MPAPPGGGITSCYVFHALFYPSIITLGGGLSLSIWYVLETPFRRALPTNHVHGEIPSHVQDLGHLLVTAPAAGKSPSRISALVALTLLEVIRYQDAPTEVLESEDPSHTMPRRLGLSDVIDRQIRRYRDEVHSRGRISDDEFRDLVRLVIRRPDSEDVFYDAGSILAADDSPPGWRGHIPISWGFRLARRQVRRRLVKLFGRRVGGFAAGPFTLEARTHLFVDGDPGGDACRFLTGFCQAVLQRYHGSRVRVVHALCESRQDALCRWTVLAEERATDEAHALILNPELGTG